MASKALRSSDMPIENGDEDTIVAYFYGKNGGNLNQNKLFKPFVYIHLSLCSNSEEFTKNQEL